MRLAILLPFALNILPAVSAAPEPVAWIPHVVDGGFWKTAVKAVNLGTHPITLRIEFYKDGGTSMPLPIVGSTEVTGGNLVGITLSLAPAQSVTVETAGTAQALTSGWGVAYQLQSVPEPMGVMAIYTQRVPGGQDQEATVPATAGIRTTAAMLFDNTKFVTGIAMLNTEPASVSVIAKIHDRTGKVIDQQTLLLTPNTHLAFVLPTQWPSTAGIAGWIEFIYTGTNLPAFGLRFNGTAFTTFSPFPINQ